MARPSPQSIFDIVLSRRVVYDLETESRIREAANRFTARALLELLQQFDDEAPDFSRKLCQTLCETVGGELSYTIGFDTGNSRRVDAGSRGEPVRPSEHYLKLVFRNEEAAMYQFPLFPNFDRDYVLGASRKRAGAVQHLRIELSDPEALQAFIESCRSNPHLMRVERSTEEEFQAAPSHGV